MNQKQLKVIGMVLSGGLALLLIQPAHSQMDPNTTVSRIIHVFRDNISQWQSPLTNYALGLFWSLAGIEFTWTAIKLALKQADLSEFLAALVNRILYIGFFLTLLLHSSEWANAIVQSFRMAAGAAGGTQQIHPANILDLALQITTKLFNSTTILNPQDAIISGLCGIAILLCFGFMAANMIEALIESYIVISAGVIMMGFGGSSWTHEYAKKILAYAVSVGAKLFLIQILMGLCENLVSQLANEFNGANLDDALVMVGVAVIMAIVTLNVPNKLQGLINGTSLGSGGLIAGAVTAGAAAGASAAMTLASGGTHTAAGLASAGKGGLKLASEQLKESGTDAPPSMAKLAKQAAQNIGQAGLATLGQRFRGEMRPGNLGMQIGQHLDQRAEMLKEKNGSTAGNKPASPSTGAQKTTTPSPPPKNSIYPA